MPEHTQETSRLKDPLSENLSAPKTGSGWNLSPDALLNATLSVLGKNSLKAMIVLMTFGLSVWSMLTPNWMRVAITGTFTLCVTVILNLGFREK